MPITNLIRDNWCRFQGELFPEIQDAVGPLLKNHQRFVMALQSTRLILKYRSCLDLKVIVWGKFFARHEGLFRGHAGSIA